MLRQTRRCVASCASSWKTPQTAASTCRLRLRRRRSARCSTCCAQNSKAQRLPLRSSGYGCRRLQLEEGGEAQALFSADDFDPQRVAVTIARLEAVLGEERRASQDARSASARGAIRLRTIYPVILSPVEGCRLGRRAATPKDAARARSAVAAARSARSIRYSCAAASRRSSIGKRCCSASGPWRIAERPYAPAPVTRDEYDVVLEDGTFARIYRQGSHWYLRGVYE